MKYIDPTGLYCVGDGSGGFWDDDQGGQTCDQAFAPENNNQPTVTVYGDSPNLGTWYSGYGSGGATITNSGGYSGNGSGGGSAGDQSTAFMRGQPSPNNPGFNKCKAWALAKGAFHVGLDVAGAIPFVGAPVSVVNALTTETAAAFQFGASLATTDYSDSKGVALTYTGAAVTFAARSAVAGSKLSEAVPFAGIAVGVITTAYDGHAAYEEYHACGAGE